METKKIESIARQILRAPILMTCLTKHDALQTASSELIEHLNVVQRGAVLPAVQRLKKSTKSLRKSA